MKYLFFCTLLLSLLQANAQAVKSTLNSKEKSIVTIAALTASGDLPKLKQALARGLDAGLTLNQTKEILIHLYAYCGFPRSLNAINTLIAVTDERKASGRKEVDGEAPQSLPANADRYAIGKSNLARLTGRMETGPKRGYAAFVPVIDTFLKEHLFADIFARGVLTDQERELTTVSALSSLGNVQSQLQGHLTIAVHVGWSIAQLEQMLAIIETSIGKSEAAAGRGVLNKVVPSAG